MRLHAHAAPLGRGSAHSGCACRRCSCLRVKSALMQASISSGRPCLFHLLLACLSRMVHMLIVHTCLSAVSWQHLEQRELCLCVQRRVRS